MPPIRIESSLTPGIGRRARERRRHEDEREQAESARVTAGSLPRISRVGRPFHAQADSLPGGNSNAFLQAPDSHRSARRRRGPRTRARRDLGAVGRGHERQALLLVAGPEHPDARPAGERHHLPRRQRRSGRGRRPDQAVRLPHLVGHRVEGRLQDRRHRREALRLQDASDLPELLHARRRRQQVPRRPDAVLPRHPRRLGDLRRRPGRRVHHEPEDRSTRAPGPIRIPSPTRSSATGWPRT